jgi:hypothetical protein
MKKLIIFLTMVMVVAIVTSNATMASSAMDKGITTVTMNVIIPVTGIDLTAETLPDVWVQQNSSIALFAVAIMNNSQNLMFGYATDSPTNSSNLVANSNLEPYRRVVETGAEVTKIGSYEVAVNNSLDGAANISNGANVCNASIVC